jgi:hypothetical protein
VNPFLSILAPFLGALLGLYMFTSLLTALAYAGIIGLFMVFAVRRYEKHHAENMYDDRLTTERVDRSREWLVNKWQDEE